MELLKTIVAMTREHRWGAILILLFITLAACEEIPVDTDTANVTRRAGDTIVRYDTTMLRDTIIEIDTVINTERDTIITIDTVIRTKEIIIRDTITVVDTVRLGGVRDTVVHYDTVRKSDTLYLYEFEQLEARAILYRKDGERIRDSVLVAIDRVTKVTIPGQGRDLPWFGLKFVGHVPQQFDSVMWGIPPSMIYLVIQEIGLQNGKGKKELSADPRIDGNSGLAVVPYPPLDAQWLATGRMGEAEFGVTSIDADNRYIYAYVKASFVEKSVHLDSMALKLKY